MPGIARTTDWLTGIPDRRALRSHLEMLLADGMQDTHYSILAIDLDRFAYVNHFIGFIEGDKALATLARATAGLIPSDGFLARTGGDEFVVLVPDDARGSRGIELAGQLLGGVRECLQFLATPDALTAMSTTTSPFTASIGAMSFSGRSVLTFDDLVREAFERAEFAKRSGRNRVWAQAVVVEQGATR